MHIGTCMALREQHHPCNTTLLQQQRVPPPVNQRHQQHPSINPLKRNSTPIATWKSTGLTQQQCTTTTRHCSGEGTPCHQHEQAVQFAPGPPCPMHRCTGMHTLTCSESVAWRQQHYDATPLQHNANHDVMSPQRGTTMM